MDENVDIIYLNQIRRRNPNIVVRAVGSIAAPEKGTLDPEILKWCETKQFVLVTNNRKSMPLHLSDHLAAGRHIPGIITLSRTMSIGEIIEELIFLAEASLEEDFLDQIKHMPII
jgi:hypothetical protein